MSLRDFTARLRASLSGAKDDREFAQELQSHLEMLTDTGLCVTTAEPGTSSTRLPACHPR
jgi:hypothetical protein